MYKNYFTLLTLLAVLAIAASAFSAQAHGNKKHPAAKVQTTTQQVEQNSVPTPQMPDKGHNGDEKAHDGTSHDDAGTVLAHDESGTAAHEHQEGMAEEEEEGHSHWGDNGPSTPFEKTLAYLGNFHSLLVHFPIALFLTAALAQGLLLTGRKGNLESVVRFTVWVGAFGALVAGLLGWAHAGPTPAHESSVMMSHRWIGTALLVGGFAMAFLMEAARHSKNTGAMTIVFNLALFLMAAFVAINGFLGGALAHGGMSHLMPGMMG